jgi:regulator of telomere elongation helicase 1
VLHNA